MNIDGRAPGLDFGVSGFSNAGEVFELSGFELRLKLLQLVLMSKSVRFGHSLLKLLLFFLYYKVFHFPFFFSLSFIFQVKLAF